MSNTTEQVYLQEDEIDLKELFQTILKYKYKIALFTFIVTSLTIVYTLSKPNTYQSSVVLSPQGQSKPSSLGGLSALAGMAGVDLGSSEVDVYTLLNTTLKDFTFNSYLIEKYNLIEKINIPKEKMVFALGYDGIYDLFNPQATNKEEKSKEDVIYETNKQLLQSISLTSDKKTSLITLSIQTTDRMLSKYLVDIYLKELTTYVRKREMKENEKKITYYKNELANTSDIALKQQLSVLLTGLMQKSVLSKANEYYNVSIISDSRVSHIKEKVKPKRGLIVVVSFVTSIIIGIFGVFFIEFLKNKEEDNLPTK